MTTRTPHDKDLSSALAKLSCLLGVILAPLLVAVVRAPSALATPTQVAIHLDGIHPVGADHHEGTFTASPPLCASGSWLGNGANQRVFTCADGSGTFTASFNGELEHATGGTGPWKIFAGTGTYAALRGEGTATIDFSTGESASPITFRDTWTGTVDFDATAPTGSVVAVKVTHARTTRGLSTVKIVFTARDNVESNAVSFRATAAAGPFFASRSGIVRAGTGSFTLAFHATKLMRLMRVEIALSDRWGNQSTIKKSVRLRQSTGIVRRASAALAPSTAALTLRGHEQALLFDAVFTQAHTSGPPADKVGHEQIASGHVLNGRGRRVGEFAVTCRWVKRLADDVLERCSDGVQTSDGRLDLDGRSPSGATTRLWRVVGGSGAYGGAGGAVTIQDIGESESLISVTLRTRAGAVLHAGIVPRPAVNKAFIARANRICARAAAALSALPPFPFAHFDPMHPDRSVLPKVGRFFAGPGDSRPIYRRLDARLRALGTPPANRTAWTNVLAGRNAFLVAINDVAKAALAADIATWSKSVRVNQVTHRRAAIAAGVFGATGCVLG